jgi:hypothetical protein
MEHDFRERSIGLGRHVTVIFGHVSGGDMVLSALTQL